MRNNKFITVLISILIIAILGVLGFFVYHLYTESMQTGNYNVENIEQENPTINTANSNNNQVENQTTIEPIIGQITPNGSNAAQGSNSFVSSYYYSQLNETAKEIYDGLKANKDNLISGNYTIDYGTKFNTLLNSEGGEEKLNIAFQSAWDAFSYDNVDLFYIDATKITLTNEYYSLGGIKTYKISIGAGNNGSYFQDTFKTKAEVETAQNYLEYIKEQMVEQTAEDDTYTKIAKVHNWLIYYITYENSETLKDQHTIYGALKNGKAVCEGYARAFKYLMDAVGVPCVLVSGIGTNSRGQPESHAWNYVQINDIWYAVDVTWDDPIVTGGEQTRAMKYKYFLKGSEGFFTDHIEDGHISEDSIEFKFPTLSTSDYINN